MLTEGALPSALQRRLYRRRGYRIAADVDLSPGVVIDAEEVDIHAGVSIGFGTVIRGKRVRIGRRATIGSFCFFEGRDIEIGDDTTIREQVFVGGPLFPDSALIIGKRVRVFQTCFLNPSKPLRIGGETGVGGRSSIFTHGSWQSELEGFPVTFAPVTIGENVWLPWHVFILPGVEIGDNATVGGGSLVNRSLPARSLSAGVPAKVLRTSEEWPKRIEPDEQWAKARAMVDQLAGVLVDNGVRVVAERETPDLVELGVLHHGGRDSMVLARDSGYVESGDGLAIVLHGLPDDTSRPWLALLARKKGGRPTALAAEAEDFIGRYGIRFAPIDEA